MSEPLLLKFDSAISYYILGEFHFCLEQAQKGTVGRCSLADNLSQILLTLTSCREWGPRFLSNKVVQPELDFTQIEIA